MPLVGQHPGIGHVAIQARCEHQEHDAHFVAFAAEVLARQAVAEFVNDFGHGQRGAQIDPVLGLEELMKRGQLIVKRVELHQDQNQGREG